MKKMTYKMIWFTVYFTFTTPLFSELPDSKKIEEMETKLATVSGKEKMELLNQLGDCYLEKNPEKTLKYGKRVLDLSKTIPNSEGRGYALLNMAKANIQLKKRGRGLDLLTEAHRIFEKRKNKKGIVNVNLLVAYINLLDNDYQEALKYYSEAYQLCNQVLDNYYELKNIYINSGIIYHRFRDEKRAISYYKKGLQLAEQAEHKEDIALFYEQLGDVYSSMRKQNQALTYFQKALRLYEELVIPEKMAIQNINIASVLRDDNKALGYLEEALKQSKKFKNKDLYIRVLTLIANRYSQIKNFKIAEQYYQEALKIGFPSNDYSLYKEISNLYYAMEEYKNALDFYKKYTRGKDKMANIQKNNQITRIKEKYIVEKRKSERESLKMEKRYQLILFISGCFLIAIMLVLLLKKYLPFFVSRRKRE